MLPKNIRKGTDSRNPALPSKPETQTKQNKARDSINSRPISLTDSDAEILDKTLRNGVQQH